MTRWFPVVLFAMFVLTASGCSYAWNSDQDAFAVHFTNDLGVPVVLALCHSDHSSTCEHPYYRRGIDAGGTHAENIATGQRTEWAIDDDRGRLLRCIVLYWKHWPHHDEQVILSNAPIWTRSCLRTTPARVD